MFAQLFTAKVGAFAAVALFTAGTAAAATGNLPDPLPRGSASTLSHDVVERSGSADESTTTETPTSTTTTETPTSTTLTDATTTTSSTAVDSASDGAVGPDANGPAKHGLCTAYFAGHAKNPDAVAFRNLVEAANASGTTVEAFCAVTTTTTGVTTTSAMTTDDATTAPGHGKSGSTPGATAPGRMSSPPNSHGKP